MNALTLVKNFMHGETEEFRSNFNKLMELKIAKSKLPYATACVEGIFKRDQPLNRYEDLDCLALEIIRESIRQNSNIPITLKNGDDVILESKQSQSILKTFDLLNESNQKTLINNLFLTKSHFKSSVDFCLKAQKG